QLLVWQGEIADLKTAVGLWQMVTSDDRKGLSKSIKWDTNDHDGNHVVYWPTSACPPQDQRIIASQRQYKHPMDLFHKDDPVLPAMHFVRLLANRRIEDHVGPTLAYDPQGSDPATDFKVRLEPKNLCGAIWLQFTLAVGGHKEFLECEGCTNWFEVASGG